MFALLMLSLCVILHTMWSGKSLSAISMMVVIKLLSVCMLMGMVV